MPITCGYWPPEVIKEQPYTVEPDYWALGCTAFQMFCDRLPFYGNNDDEKNEMILDGSIRSFRGSETANG